jgi:hypothetical protein
MRGSHSAAVKFQSRIKEIHSCRPEGVSMTSQSVDVIPPGSAARYRNHLAHFLIVALGRSILNSLKNRNFVCGFEKS